MRVALRALLVLVFASSALVLGPALPARAQGQPRVLFIPAPTLPSTLRAGIPRVLRTQARLVSTDAYLSQVRDRGLRANSASALRRFAVGRGADVIVIAGFRAWGRSRTLSLQYRDGQTGEVIASASHQLRGASLSGGVQQRILSQLRAARSRASGAGRDRGHRGRDRSPPPPVEEEAEAQAEEQAEEEAPEEVEEEPEEEAEEEPEEEPEEGRGRRLPPPVAWDEEGEEEGDAEVGRGRRLPPPVAWDEEGEEEGDAEEEEDEEGEDDEAGEDDEEGEDDPEDGEPRPLVFSAAAGVGFGLRSNSLPTEAGAARLTTSPFPAARIGLGVTLRTSDDESVRLGASVRYASSIGLRVVDQRPDMTTRTVDARSQSLFVAADGFFRLSSSKQAAVLEVSAGYAFRLLSTEGPISMPEYTLSGPFARVGVRFPLGSGPLSLAIAPEVASVSGLSEALQQVGAVKPGVAIGAEASIRVRVMHDVDIDASYREAHVLLESDFAGSMSDVERWGIVGVTYRP